MGGGSNGPIPVNMLGIMERVCIIVQGIRAPMIDTKMMIYLQGRWVTVLSIAPDGARPRR